jgi:hypothetical protein
MRRVEDNVSSNGSGEHDTLESLVEARLREMVRAALSPERVGRIIAEELRAATAPTQVPVTASPEPETNAEMAAREFGAAVQRAKTKDAAAAEKRRRDRRSHGVIGEATKVGAMRHGRVVMSLKRGSPHDDARSRRVTVRCETCKRVNTVQALAWYQNGCLCHLGVSGAQRLGEMAERHATLLAETLRDALRPGEVLEQDVAAWSAALPLADTLPDPRTLGRAFAHLAKAPRENVAVTRTKTSKGSYVWRVERAKTVGR